MTKEEIDALEAGDVLYNKYLKDERYTVIKVGGEYESIVHVRPISQPHFTGIIIQDQLISYNWIKEINWDKELNNLKKLTD